MDSSAGSPGMTRRAFCISFGAGMTVLGAPSRRQYGGQESPNSTGIDALFAAFVVVAERRIFEKYGLATSYKPFDDGNVAPRRGAHRQRRHWLDQ